MDEAEATTQHFVLLPISAAAQRCSVPEAQIRRWLAEDILTPIPFAGETMVNVRQVEVALRMHAPQRRARTLRLHRLIGAGDVVAALLAGLAAAGVGPTEEGRPPWWLALCLLGLLVGLLLWTGAGLRPQRRAPRPAQSPAWVPTGQGGPPSVPPRGRPPAAAFIPLGHEATLQRLIIASGGEPILLFLHDRWSSISTAAHQELARVPAEVWVVAVDRQSDLAHAIVAQTRVRAEWPQAIVLRRGRAVWTASYWSITAAAVTQAMEHHAPAGGRQDRRRRWQRRAG